MRVEDGVFCANKTVLQSFLINDILFLISYIKRWNYAKSLIFQPPVDKIDHSFGN